MHAVDLLPSYVSSSMNGSQDQPPLGFTPRYAEHFVGAAALLGAFGLVFGAMALGIVRVAQMAAISSNDVSAAARQLDMQGPGSCSGRP